MKIDAHKIAQDFTILDQSVNDEPWFILTMQQQLRNHKKFLMPLMIIITRLMLMPLWCHTLAERATAAMKQVVKKRQFINAKSTKEVLFTRGTTTDLIARTLRKKYFSKDDEVLISVLEHHANVVPWQQFVKTGAN